MFNLLDVVVGITVMAVALVFLVSCFIDPNPADTDAENTDASDPFYHW